MCDRDSSYDSVGISGGIVLSICLIPQIYEIIKTKHVDNISYLWQLLYLIGLILNITYTIHYDLKPLYIPTVFELLFVILLIILKYIYSRNENNTAVRKRESTLV